MAGWKIHQILDGIYEERWGFSSQQFASLPEGLVKFSFACGNAIEELL